MFDEMLVRVIFEFLLLWSLRLLVMLLRLLSFCIWLFTTSKQLGLNKIFYPKI
ncbi:hypothetical protein Patl1_02810 [Pistacia atlantica]|uniref:Uncharacterized protein n=1 Tax=Pistacia atlantica TaxID=434234 RepID=A0ACC1C7Q1_9ROSI|nr:hypothetical protein Patl1_02810 [Pistacia atlantica]